MKKQTESLLEAEEQQNKVDWAEMIDRLMEDVKEPPQKKRPLNKQEIKTLADEIRKETAMEVSADVVSADEADGVKEEPKAHIAKQNQTALAENTNLFGLIDGVVKAEDIIPQTKKRAKKTASKPTPKAEKAEKKEAELNFSAKKKAAKKEKVMDEKSRAIAEQAVRSLADGEVEVKEPKIINISVAMPEQLPAKKKINASAISQKIAAYMAKNPIIPCDFIYFAQFPSDEESKKFLIEGGVSTAKLFVWDGEAQFAFMADNLEVFEVTQNQGVPHLVRGEWQWKLQKYAQKPKFLAQFAVICQPKRKAQKVIMENLAEWHKTLTSKVIVGFDDLQKYQTALDQAQTENIEIYESRKQDFQDCTKAESGLKNFFKKL